MGHLLRYLHEAVFTFTNFAKMEVVGTGADSVLLTPCFDAHAAALAVKDPLLPLLQGDSRFDFGDCCCDVGHDETPVCSVQFTLAEFFERCAGVQFARAECFVHCYLEFSLSFLLDLWQTWVI